MLHLYKMGASYRGIWAEGDARADPWRTEPAYNSGSTNRSRTWHRCILGGGEPLLELWPWEAYSAETPPLTLPLLILTQFLSILAPRSKWGPWNTHLSGLCKVLYNLQNVTQMREIWVLFSSYNPKVKIGDKRKAWRMCLVPSDTRMPLSAGGVCGALWITR